MPEVAVQRSDLEKVFDALENALQFHRSRDEMNARLHLAPNVRYSPLTSTLEAERDRVGVLLRDAPSV